MKISGIVTGCVIPCAIFALGWFVFYHESSEAYLYPHEKAQEFFDVFHDEGYESIESVAYIGMPEHPLILPSELKGMVDGKEVDSNVTVFSTKNKIKALTDVSKAFQMNVHGCPEGLSAIRSEAGWVYEVTPSIQSKKHREDIEECLGLTIAGVYEIKKTFDKAGVDDPKEAEARKASWENAPRPE